MKVEDAFENNDVDVVAEKLGGMQGSLRLLQHAADYQVHDDQLKMTCPVYNVHCKCVQERVLAKVPENTAMFIRL